MRRASPFALFAALALMVSVAVAADGPAGLPRIGKSARHALQRTLAQHFDRNRDGVVRTAEVHASLEQHGINENNHGNGGDDSLGALLPRGCRRSLDPVDAVDCVRSHAHTHLLGGDEEADAEVIDWEVALRLMLLDGSDSVCTDDMPPLATGNDQDILLCSDFLENELFDAVPGGKKQDTLKRESGLALPRDCDVLVKQGYCLLSCHACDPFLRTILYADGQVDTSGVNAVMAAERGHERAATDAVPLVILSDIHIEPWYDTAGNESVSRYSDPTIEEMFECKTNDEGPTPCYLTGVSDPPMSLPVNSLLQNFLDSVDNAKSVWLYVGDTQAHNFGEDEDTYSMSEAVGTLMDTFLDTVLGMGSFAKKNMFAVPGNNCGPHYAVFVDPTDDSTVAYADSVVGHELVNNDLGFTYSMPDGETTLNQVDFYYQTGYAVKQLDRDNELGLRDANVFFILTNTIRGANDTLQLDALDRDIQRILDLGGKMFFVGHQPGVLNAWMLAIRLRYSEDADDFILGSFAGHLHRFTSTLPGQFTQLPAVTESARVAAYYRTSLFPTQDENRMHLDYSVDMWEYVGAAGETASSTAWENGVTHTDDQDKN